MPMAWQRLQHFKFSQRLVQQIDIQFVQFPERTYYRTKLFLIRETYVIY